MGLLMPLEFAESPRSSLGLEWELMLVDPVTGDLVPEGPALLESLRRAGHGDGVTGELFTNTIEVTSRPRAFVAEAIEDVVERIAAVRAAAEPLGLALIGAGSHPFAQWFEQSVTVSGRYRKFVERTQWWGRNMMIWGVHVHIGVESRDKVMPLIAGLGTHLPHLLALSASSPFWAGERTGYASNRALMFQQLPTAGLPWALERWGDFEGYVGDLVRTGIIEDATEVRWDIRPAPRWGTIELRACDAVATPGELAALAALTQCLVEALSRRLDAGEPITVLPPWYQRENRWRAARYGLDAIIIVDAEGREVPCTEHLAELLETLAPIARDLGCTAELDGVRRILEEGAGYQRQLARGEDPAAVARSLIEEFDAGRPLS